MMKMKTVKIRESIHQKLLKVVILRDRVSAEINKEAGEVSVTKWDQEDIIDQGLQELIEVWKRHYPELVNEIFENKDK